MVLESLEAVDATHADHKDGYPLQQGREAIRGRSFTPQPEGPRGVVKDSPHTGPTFSEPIKEPHGGGEKHPSPAALMYVYITLMARDHAEHGHAPLVVHGPLLAAHCHHRRAVVRSWVDPVFCYY